MFVPKPNFAMIPQVGTVPAPNWAQFAKPLQMLRFGGRMLPYVGPAMLAWDLIEFGLRPLEQGVPNFHYDPAAYGGIPCENNQPLTHQGCSWIAMSPGVASVCGQLPIPLQPSGSNRVYTSYDGTDVAGGSPPGTLPAASGASYVKVGPYQPVANCGRVVWQQEYYFPNGRPAIAPAPPVPDSPAVYVPLTRSVPQRSPSPRWARPPAPDYDVGPRPGPNPNERPVPRYRAPPLPGAPWRPSLDLEITPQPHPVPVRPGIHREVPPGPKEKEKKSDPLHGGRAAAWLKGMGFVINGFTETDDVVRAIYNSLPWQERRWKGRDGVWRDRDLYTHDKIARIVLLSERVDTAKMLDNITKTVLTDQLGGFLGRMNKASIRANRYYAAKHGWQQGQRLSKANWEKLKADLRRAAVENNPVPGHTKWHRVYSDDVEGSHRRGEKVIHPQQLGLPVSQWDQYYRDQKWHWAKEEIPDAPFSLNQTYIPWLYRKTPVYYTRDGKLGYDRNALGNPNHYRWRNHHYFESND